MITPPPGAESFTLGPADGPRVLLFHGLTGTPAELWPLAVGLAAAGYRTEAPLWEGHGTTPADLARVTAGQLITHARRLGAEREPFAIAGLSMGALLAIIAASACRNLRALVLMAPAINLVGNNGVFMWLGKYRLLRYVPLLLSKSHSASSPDADADVGEWDSSAARAAGEAASAIPRDLATGHYDRIPLRWAPELVAIRAEAHRVAPQVHVPTLLLHGARDKTSSMSSSFEAVQWLGGESRVHVYPRSPHVMTVGPERGAIAADICAFLETLRHADEPAALRAPPSPAAG